MKVAFAASVAVVSVPEAALVPLHPPLAEQDVAPVELQVRVEVCPEVIEVGFAEKVTDGGGGSVTATVAELEPEPPGPVQVSM